MKVAVNTRFLIKDKLEGIGVFSHEILKRICQKHPEHEFHFFFDRPVSPDFQFSSNIKSHILWPPARHPFLWLIWYEYSLQRELKKLKADVFVSMDGMIPLRSKTKSIAVIHDLAFESYPKAVPFLVRNFYKFFFVRYARKAEKIITVSDFSKMDIMLKYNIPDKKIHVVNNASKDIFKAVGAESKIVVKDKYTGGKDYFLYVGALHPRKNITNLLQGFDLYKKRYPNGHKLLITGRKAWQTKEMEDSYRSMKHKDDVVFTGWVNDKELADITASASALVYVSLFEGFGIPVLDAMNCDVPLIVSNTTSLPEVAGDAAIYVNPLSQKEIAEAMQKISTDNEFRVKMIAHARLQRQNFCWDRSADKFYSVMCS